MKKFQRVLFVSAAVSALIAPMSALEVLKDDDKSLEVYGSVRGYVGFGGSASATDTMNQGSIAATQAWGPYGSALYGLQGNSRLGVKAKVGNLSAAAELGYVEDSQYGAFRQLWGSYSFGSAGALLFGRTDTPSVAKALFASDAANTDQGQAGFGGLRTSNRKLQLSYSITGFTIALVDDSGTIGAVQNEAIPRIAASYYLQNEDKTLDFQVGGAYKYYNLGVRAAGEGNSRFVGGSGSAFHIFTAVKSQMMEKSLYVSGMLHYGMNADLYKEQNTSYNDGAYAHTEWISANNSDIHRVGAYVESGYKINDMLSGVLGLGYQWSAVVGHTATTSQLAEEAHTMTVMAQLPIKLEKSLTLTPQVGYYGGFKATGIDANGYASGIESRHGLLAFVRLRYDF
ncbi:hypothetical protein [Helicobacter sp.]|uniref:hypothetical protein n=1 Tax=Helicobacter sp. TaxID=218 RepID=UPI00388E789F